MNQGVSTRMRPRFESSSIECAPIVGRHANPTAKAEITILRVPLTPVFSGGTNYEL